MSIGVRTTFSLEAILDTVSLHARDPTGLACRHSCFPCAGGKEGGRACPIDSLYRTGLHMAGT